MRRSSSCTAPADVEHRVGGKGRALRRIEFARGRDQAGEADAVEIVVVEGGGQKDAHPIDGRFHQREMAFDQRIFIPRGMVGAEGLGGLGGSGGDHG